MPLLVHAEPSRVITSTTSKPTPFLTPIPRVERDLTQSSATTSTQCRPSSLYRCPDTFHIEDDWSTGGSNDSIDDIGIELPKNLRITFYLEYLENSVVSGGGMDPYSPYDRFRNRWIGSSSAATLERHMEEPFEDGEIGLIIPGPGVIWTMTPEDGYILYDALVHDGCGNVPVFPIQWDSAIVAPKNDDEVMGSFSAFDNSTLTPTGYWYFHYTVRAMDYYGRESDFIYKGSVEAVCTSKGTY